MSWYTHRGSEDKMMRANCMVCGDPLDVAPADDAVRHEGTRHPPRAMPDPGRDRRLRPAHVCRQGQDTPGGGGRQA